MLFVACEHARTHARNKIHTLNFESMNLNYNLREKLPEYRRSLTVCAQVENEDAERIESGKVTACRDAQIFASSLCTESFSVLARMYARTQHAEASLCDNIAETNMRARSEDCQHESTHQRVSHFGYVFRF